MIDLPCYELIARHFWCERGVKETSGGFEMQAHPSSRERVGTGVITAWQYSFFKLLSGAF
jgi:hypothetical protein